MKHIVIGDAHGNYQNVFNFLKRYQAVDKKGKPINRDEISVWSIGDLIDADINREGDLTLLHHAKRWFNGICIGNHEYAMIGGPDFGGARKHDRETKKLLLELEDEGIYRPAFVVEDFLLTHAGLADRWGFSDPKDALDAISIVWDNSQDEDWDIPFFDWVGPIRAGKFADECGGIFWLDWSENRNKKIDQIVGHSTITNGPDVISYYYENSSHWNVDIGGKYGLGIGGVQIEDAKVSPVFCGQRVILKKPKFISRGRNLSESIDHMMGINTEYDEEWEEDNGDGIYEFEDPETEREFQEFRELMETI